MSETSARPGDTARLAGQVTGAAALVHALARQGVQCIFTLSGNHLLSIYDACLDAGIRLVGTRHEAAAAHMADAWARVTGEPGVCLVTAGPGHTNALTGVATAYGIDSPVIWLSGQSELGQRDLGAMQELDQVGIARPVTKLARAVDDIRRIPSDVAAAFRAAQTGRPGPVHLSLPSDILDARVDADELRFLPSVNWRAASRALGNPDLVAQAVGLLAGAERPAIIAGSGAWWGRASEPLAAFVEAANVPLFTIDAARGLVSDDHPLCFGYPDPVLNPVGRHLSRADVVLLLGKRIDFRLRFGQLFAPDARLIQVELEPDDLGRSRLPEVALAGSPGAVAMQMLAAWKERGGAGSKQVRRAWLDELRETQEAHRAWLAEREADEGQPLHPLRIVRAVREVLGDDYCLTFDAGDFIQWARSALPAREPGRWLRLGPMATLGGAIPFAIGAKAALPETRVIALSGDGGVGFYGFELDTAVRHNLPFVLVVANDAAWGMEKMLQGGIFGWDRIVASDLQPTRYDKIAEALGAHGEHVESPEQLRPALERAIASGRPSCVNVVSRMVPSAMTTAGVERKRTRG